MNIDSRLSPSTFYVWIQDANNVPKIADFGLSVMEEGIIEKAERTGNVGTPVYMAPGMHSSLQFHFFFFFVSLPFTPPPPLLPIAFQS
jgi:serine/threonine protein kinase